MAARRFFLSRVPRKRGAASSGLRSGATKEDDAPERLAEQSNARESDLICSAKGCRTPAVWALRWNNPKLHPPERRKTWLACATHRESLGDFLSARGFLREVDPVESQ